MPTGTLRAMGPYNGLVYEATGEVIGFMRDPKTFPYLQYAQLVPAPEVNFMYFNLDPDEPARLVSLNEYAWGYDDHRPDGAGFTVKGAWTTAQIGRWDFPYTIGNTTMRTWGKQGIPPKLLYDDIKGAQAGLHRASRVVNALNSANWGANAAPLQTVMNNANSFFDLSSGDETINEGFGDTANPNFQIIKRTFQRIKRFLNLSTNGAVKGSEMIAVLPPTVAEAIATSGEMVNFLKQSQYAKQLTDPDIEEWSLPPSYGGFKLVVEDTVRCFINQNDAGQVASVLVPSQKDYILDNNMIYFVSRKGGLDGAYGFRKFTTVQVYTWGGEARVEAFSESKHDLIEGHVVMEDNVQVPATIAGFQLSNVISPNFAGSIE